MSSQYAVTELFVKDRRQFDIVHMHDQVKFEVKRHILVPESLETSLSLPWGKNNHLWQFKMRNGSCSCALQSAGDEMLSSSADVEHLCGPRFFYQLVHDKGSDIKVQRHLKTHKDHHCLSICPELTEPAQSWYSAHRAGRAWHEPEGGLFGHLVRKKN